MSIFKKSQVESSNDLNHEKYKHMLMTLKRIVEVSNHLQLSTMTGTFYTKEFYDLIREAEKILRN